MFLLLPWMCFQFFRFGNSSRWRNNRENYCNENYESVFFSFIEWQCIRNYSKRNDKNVCFVFHWAVLFLWQKENNAVDHISNKVWVFGVFFSNFKRIITHCSQWLTNKHVIHLVSIDYIVIFIQLTCTVHCSLCTNVNHPMLQRYFNKMCN